MNTEGGVLWLVATPIGNLGDISARAVEALRSADVVYAEDTRRTRILLDAHAIRTRMVSYRDENEARLAGRVVEAVRDGQRVAIVSDAGTPGISDPGYRALRGVIDAGLRLEVIPGATAVTTALLLSGLPVHRFAFEGFLPVRKGRQRRLEELAVEPRTMVLFESPQRVAGTLRDLAAALGGERLAAVCREMTKVHEEVVRGTLNELAEGYAGRKVKGEVVLVVAGMGK